MSKPEFDHYFDESGRLRADCVEDLLVEVCSGKFIFPGPTDTLLASRSPTMEEQDRARILYTIRVHEARTMGLKSRRELEAISLERGLIDNKEREEKDSLFKMLERYRKAKEKTTSIDQKVELDEQIETARRRMLEIEVKEAVVLQHSAEAHAEDARINYYVACCTSSGRLLDRPLWPNYEAFEDETSVPLVHACRRGYARVMSGLPTRLIRALARNGEWRMRWSSVNDTGGSVFDGSSSNWDRNKLNLIYWSKFYDNIFNHPECPDEQTVNDDDALQAWVNHQVQKRASNLPNGVTTRKTPTYIQNGQRKPMTKIGNDKVMKVNQPYRIRT